jgi:hypothetical protein
VDKQPAAPPEFVGGRVASIFSYGFEWLGYWVSLPEHVVYAASIRFGWCADLDVWYVSWSGTPTTQWIFARRDDAERAIGELKATYDGAWEERLAPGGETRM